jgi:CBS domain-containing protein
MALRKATGPLAFDMHWTPVEFNLPLEPGGGYQRITVRYAEPSEMKVREIMTSPAITVHESCLLEEAAKLMLERGIGCLPVVNSRGELCGIVTESDFTAKQKAVPFSLYRFPQLFGDWMPKEGIERIYEAARGMAVSEIMSRNVVCVSENEAVEELLAKMLRHGFHHVPVVRDRAPIGIVARHDLLRLMSMQLPSAPILRIRR